jgi:O-antigen/teichoic acid export membrane protein
MIFKKLTNSFIVYGITNALKSLVPFLMLPILTKYMSIKEYGELSLIETSVLFLLPFVMLNIHGAINVEYFKHKDFLEFKKYVVNAIFISFISFLIVFVIIYFLQNEIEKIVKIDLVWIKFLAIFAFLRVLPNVLLVIFQASQKPKLYAFYFISQTITDFSLSYLLVVIYHYSLVGRLIGIYGSFFIFSVVALFFLYDHGYFKVKLTFKYTKDILSFGIPLIFHSIGGVILAMSDRYFISYFNGNQEVGLYTVAYQISGVLLLFSISINQAWNPIFFKLMQKKEFIKIDKFIKFLIIIFILFSFLVFFISPLIYHYFVDKKFYDSKIYFLPLLLGFTFQSFYFLFTNYMFFYKKTMIISFITFVGAIINLLLNYLLIKLYGPIGVAYATAITWFLYFLSVYLVAKYYRRKLIDEKN